MNEKPVSAKSRLWLWGAGASTFAVSSAVVVCLIWDGGTLPGLARHLGYLAALILAGLSGACIVGLLASKISDKNDEDHEDRVVTRFVELLFLYGGKPFETLDKLYRKALDPTAAATTPAEGGARETETGIKKLIERSKTRPLTNADAFRLYSLWAETAQGEGLSCLVLTLSDHYGAVLGAAKLAEYRERYPLDIDLDLKNDDTLRAHARRLLCRLLEVWRRKRAAEAIRNRLSAITAVVTLGVAIPFLVWLCFFDKPPLVVAAMFAGAIGGFVSIQQRIQRLADEDQTKLFGEGSAEGGLLPSRVAPPWRTRLRRRSAQCEMRPIRWGSLMRHFLRRAGRTPLSVTRLASGVVMPPRPLPLIPSPGGAALLPPALLGAGLAAVPLTAVTDRANRNQATAAHAGKEPVVRPHRQPSGCPGAGRRSGLRRY